MRLNCWEVKKCGFQPGGEKSKVYGTCPAATEVRANGINGGQNGGRACWAIKNTKCMELNNQSVLSHKLGNCLCCEFYERVRREEKANFVVTREIMKVLEYQSYSPCPVQQFSCKPCSDAQKRYPQKYRVRNQRENNNSGR